MQRTSRIAIQAALACLVGVSASAALASPLEDPTLGGAVFTGAVHPHATSLFLNPAALGLTGPGSHFYADSSLRFDQYDIDRQILRDPDVGLAPGPQVSSSMFTPGGSLAWYSSGEKISLGAALSLVMLDRYIDDQDEALGFHTTGGRHRQYVWRRIYFLRRQWELPLSLPLPMPTLGASYKWRNFHFGVSVSLRASSYDLGFYRDTALEAGRPGIEAPCDETDTPCGIANPNAAEHYEISASSADLLTANNLVVSGGLMWQFRPGWWFGVYYKSPPGFLSSISLIGTATITPTPFSGEEPFSAQAEIIYQLPQTVEAGLRGPLFGNIEAFATARWQSLSRQRILDIRLINPVIGGGEVPERYPRFRGFEDVLTLQAGLEERPGGRLRLGARVRLETPAVRDNAISPAQFDGLNLSAFGGAELRLFDRPKLSLYASYGLTYYPTVTAGEGSLFNPLARLECVDERYALDVCVPAAEGRAIPTAAGTYSRIRHSLRAAIRYDF